MTTKEEKVLWALLEQFEKRIKLLETLVNTVSASVVEFYTFRDGKFEKVENMFLKISQKLPVVVAFKDAQGNPAKVDGTPAWAVTDEALASLEVAEDGMSAVVVPKGLTGAFKVQVQADADLGEGIKTILGELDVELLSGEAVVVELTAGEPVDI